MIDFEDEILDGVPKYRIRDAQGNVVMDDFTIELITPTIQEGTPLNKPTYENLQNYIKSVDRFNDVTIEYDANRTTEVKGNLFPTNWELVSTNNYKSGNATLTFAGTSALEVNKGFDGDDSTYFQTNTNSNDGRHPTTLDFGSMIKVKQLSVKASASGYLSVQVSRDNETWEEVLYVYSPSYKDRIYIDLPTSSGGYRYFRIVGKSTQSLYSYRVYSFETVWAEVEGAQVLKLNLNLDSLEKGKLINIKIPSYYDMSQHIHYIKLGDNLVIPSKAYLVAGEEYTLEYNGTEFVAVESPHGEYMTWTPTSDDSWIDATKEFELEIGSAKTMLLSVKGRRGSSNSSYTGSIFMVIDVERQNILFSYRNSYNDSKGYIYAFPDSIEFINNSNNTNNAKIKNMRIEGSKLKFTVSLYIYDNVGYTTVQSILLY